MAADLHFELHRAATFRVTALGRRPIEAHADYRQTQPYAASAVLGGTTEDIQANAVLAGERSCAQTQFSLGVP